MGERGVKTSPCDSVVIYEYEGLFKDGYVINFMAVPKMLWYLLNN